MAKAPEKKKAEKKDERASLEQQANEISGKKHESSSSSSASDSIPSRSSRVIEANKIISEDIKAEIYEISEVVLDEKVREFSKRISELELFRAQALESISEMREDVSELRSMVSKQKIGSVEQLSKINEQLNSLSGNMNAMEKVVISSLDGLARSAGEKRK